VISDILVSNQIETFELLNDHEPNSDHKPLTLNLNIAMHRSVIEENYDNQRQLHFDTRKFDLFLKDLNSKLNLLTYKDNIEELCHNFTTTLPTSINKFSFEVSCKIIIIERPTLGMIKNVKLLVNPLGMLPMSP
jgi:hypothetical protein